MTDKGWFAENRIGERGRNRVEAGLAVLLQARHLLRIPTRNAHGAVRTEPDHITGPNFFDGATPALDPAAASGDNQGLTERMRVSEFDALG